MPEDEERFVEIVKEKNKQWDKRFEEAQKETGVYCLDDNKSRTGDLMLKPETDTIEKMTAAYKATPGSKELEENEDIRDVLYNGLFLASDIERHKVVAAIIGDDARTLSDWIFETVGEMYGTDDYDDLSDKATATLKKLLDSIGIKY